MRLGRLYRPTFIGSFLSESLINFSFFLNVRWFEEISQKRKGYYDVKKRQYATYEAVKFLCEHPDPIKEPEFHNQIIRLFNALVTYKPTMSLAHLAKLIQEFNKNDNWVLPKASFLLQSVDCPENLKWLLPDILTMFLLSKNPVVDLISKYDYSDNALTLIGELACDWDNLFQHAEDLIKQDNPNIKLILRLLDEIISRHWFGYKYRDKTCLYDILIEQNNKKLWKYAVFKDANMFFEWAQRKISKDNKEVKEYLYLLRDLPGFRDKKGNNILHALCHTYMKNEEKYTKLYKILLTKGLAIQQNNKGYYPSYYALKLHNELLIKSLVKVGKWKFDGLELSDLLYIHEVLLWERKLAGTFLRHYIEDRYHLSERDTELLIAYFTGEDNVWQEQLNQTYRIDELVLDCIVDSNILYYLKFKMIYRTIYFQNDYVVLDRESLLKHAKQTKYALYNWLKKHDSPEVQLMFSLKVRDQINLCDENARAIRTNELAWDWREAGLNGLSLHSFLKIIPQYLNPLDIDLTSFRAFFLPIQDRSPILNNKEEEQQLLVSYYECFEINIKHKGSVCLLVQLLLLGCNKKKFISEIELAPILKLFDLGFISYNHYIDCQRTVLQYVMKHNMQDTIIETFMAKCDLNVRDINGLTANNYPIISQVLRDKIWWQRQLSNVQSNIITLN